MQRRRRGVSPLFARTVKDEEAELQAQLPSGNDAVSLYAQKVLNTIDQNPQWGHVAKLKLLTNLRHESGRA